ncbi:MULTISPECIES: hypothetical protein [Cyanophyceae]|nr:MULTISPECIES: hypothetical protein [Cyanophyceae]MBD1915044.1 hypothetical protein [Phormidium sp. FACHB-77]MBD2030792.1 hypothetical protein [Phormidium sp. FACHB-322]MBD2053145.1 hypothetical protein [Leptolyngbya sp. FACHB-60]
MTTGDRSARLYTLLSIGTAVLTSLLKTTAYLLTVRLGYCLMPLSQW